MNEKLKEKLPIIIIVSVCVLVVASFSLSGILFLRGDETIIKKNPTASQTAGYENPPAEIPDNTLSGASGTANSDQQGGSPGGQNGDGSSAVDAKTQLCVKRMFELRYLFAAPDFTSVGDLSVSAVVQYAFSHLYYTSLVDMPEKSSSGLIYREATPAAIRQQLNMLFTGAGNVDVTKSDLYDPTEKLFKMWERNLRQSVYYTVSSSQESGGKRTVTATFYTDSSKKIKKDTLKAVFQENGSQYAFVEMKKV